MSRTAEQQNSKICNLSFEIVDGDAVVSASFFYALELDQGSIHPTILNTTNNALLKDYRGIWDLFDADGSHSFRSDCFTTGLWGLPATFQVNQGGGSPIHVDATSREVEQEIKSSTEIPVSHLPNRCRFFVSFLVSNPLTPRDLPSWLGLEVEVLGKVQPSYLWTTCSVQRSRILESFHANSSDYFVQGQ